MLEFLIQSTWADRIGWILVHSLWQFALVAVLAVALQWTLHRCEAVTRYWALMAAMCILVALPVVTWYSTWPADATSAVLEETPRLQHSYSSLEEGQYSVSANLAMPTQAPTELQMAPLGEFQPVEPAPAGAASPFSLMRRHVQSRLPEIVLIWFAGVLVTALRPLLSWYMVGRLRAVGVSPVEDAVQVLVKRMAASLGVARSVEVLQSTLVNAPVVVGYFRPAILLPLSVLTGLPESQLELILAHELAHIRRHDYLVNLLQTLFETLFFYHPGVWWLSRAIRNERENCCDDVAMATVGSRADYGRALLAIEQLRAASTPLSLAARGGSLVNRIRRIAGCEPAPRIAVGGSILCILLVSLAVFVGVTWGMAPATANPEQDVAASETDTAAEATDEAPANGDWEPGQTLDVQVIHAQTKEPLRPAVRIVGSIVDAETNEPLEECTLKKGWDAHGGAPQWETEIGFPAKNITDGRYEIVLKNEYGFTRLRVEADGYMPAVSRAFKPYNFDRGLVTYDFRMKKAVSMSGTVLGPDDKPLAGAEVFLAKQQFFVENGTAAPYARSNSRGVKTDAGGRFEFPPEVEPFYLIVLHEQGHIVLDEKQFAKTPTVRIAPWLSAKRTFLLQRKQINYGGNAPEHEQQTFNVRIVDAEGNPVEDANVASSSQFHAGYNYLGDNEPAWDYFRNVISDHDGRARVADQGHIDCIVARHVERKLVAIQRISPEQVKSSETVTITMQPQCKVFGRLTAKELEARNKKIEWSNVYAYLENGRTRPMSCTPDRSGFHFYLPPGTYELEAYANDTQHARKTIMVKPGQRELEVEPIDLPPSGLVLLEGKPAPELRDVVAWKNGEPVKLSDLKGKVVVLAFSGRWVADRPHEWMPNLFTICDKYGDQGLALVDIRLGGRGIDSQAELDERIAEVKSPFWEDRDLPIPIALGLWIRPPFLWTEEEKKANKYLPCAILKDYGFNALISLPTGVLIDRQGRIVGEFDLRSDSDNAVLEKALKED